MPAMVSIREHRVGADSEVADRRSVLTASYSVDREGAWCRELLVPETQRRSGLLVQIIRLTPYCRAGKTLKPAPEFLIWFESTRFKFQAEQSDGYFTDRLLPSVFQCHSKQAFAAQQIKLNIPFTSARCVNCVYTQGRYCAGACAAAELGLKR